MIVFNVINDGNRTTMKSIIPSQYTLEDLFSIIFRM